jgi:histidinol-phosphatase
MSNQYLKTAIEAAKAAEEVIRRYYRRNVDVQLKQDKSPVTIADIESEKAIKAVIRAAFPDHGFYGEETGRENIGAEYVWLIDPIDGTKSFIRNNPVFSTQIALMCGDEIIVGVSNAPMFNELACAVAGQGAFLNGEPIRVSAVTTLADATLSVGNIGALARSESWRALGELILRLNRFRGYGDFFHYHLLAGGKLDIVIESDIGILDFAALSLIIREAGGVFTDLSGNKVALDTRTVLAAATPELHQQVLSGLQYTGLKNSLTTENTENTE